MGERVVASELSLNRNEERDRAQLRSVLRRFGARRRRIGLNRRLVVASLRRVPASFEPGSGMSEDGMCCLVGGQVFERLARRHRPSSGRAMLTDVSFPNRRGVGRDRAEQAGRQNSQRDEHPPGQR